MSEPNIKPLSEGWAIETMQIINKLTPDVKGKSFDPDWFLLRQRFEEVERLLSTNSEPQGESLSEDEGRNELRRADYGHRAEELLKKCPFKIGPSAWCYLRYEIARLISTSLAQAVPNIDTEKDLGEPGAVGPKKTSS